jgi:hypothetical protein
MRHRAANVGDSEILGELNHQLIEDEGHRNSMTIPELVERMRWVYGLQPVFGNLPKPA